MQYIFLSSEIIHIEYGTSYSIINARAASLASCSADLDKKRATSHASYIADPDTETFPPMHMQTKAFLVLTGVQIETYTTCIILKHIPFQHHPCTTHIYTNTFVTTSQKTPQNKLQKKHFAKSAKTSYVGMHFHQNTLPQKPMKKATVHTTMHAQTTHTSQCNAFTA